MNDSTDKVVSNPTYMADIRHFFTEGDFQCMTPQGINLETYSGVKLNALRLYFRVEDGSMPPPSTGRTWSKNRVKTFYNWMKNGYPRGNAAPQPVTISTTESNDADESILRVRKNITALNDAEITLLKKAFSGIMAKPADDPQSYFSLAGIHWLPGPNYYCRHHENAYNPWHRSYLIQFENALRSIEGCENITLPYWDIKDKTLPSILYEEPFKSYTIPQELCSISGQCYPAGYVTQRYDAATVAKNIHETYKIPEIIDEALGYSFWEKFNGWNGIERTQGGIILAHDNGHNASGTTMQQQNIAAFDPIFWFFHCNWDRVWWKWQQEYNATTLAQFKTHLADSDDWLVDPVLNPIPPFSETTAKTIDLTSLGVSYQHPANEPVANAVTPKVGSIKASAMNVEANPKVSIRAKGVDRTQIPGSFDAVLKADNQVISTKGFFQSEDPKACNNCKSKSIVNFDFVVDQSEICGKKIHLDIRYISNTGKMHSFPLSSCGDPTLNARILLSD